MRPKKIYHSAKTKLVDCLEKNYGLSVFHEKIFNGVNYTFKQQVYFAPLVTVDVERSFSQYKYILNDRRTPLTEESREQLNILMFNRERENTGD